MKRFYFSFVVFVISLMIYADNNAFPVPQIKVGMVRIEGRISQDNHSFVTDSVPIVIGVAHSVTARSEKYRILLNKDGSFRLTVPVESTACISIGFNNASLPFISAPDSVLRINIDLDAESQIKDIQSNGSFMSTTDMTRWFDVFSNIASFIPKQKSDHAKLLSMTPEELAHYLLKEHLPSRMAIATTDTLLSTNAKTWITKMFELFFIKTELFHYEELKRFIYHRVYPDKKAEDYVPAPLTPSYYSFLKQLDLNSPQNLYWGFYIDLLQTILTDKTLNLPTIGDIAIDTWQKQAKAVMAPLVGFDSGLFYDLLTTNAYSMQLEKLSPLTTKQKQNIEAYYKEGEIVKILLARNKDIEKMAAEKPALVINKTPDVPKEKLLDAIVAKYKGTVVYVDLWATWCGPCLQAIQESRGIKAAMKGENVVFVYLTNETSPAPLWNDKMQGIGGEHYRLNDQQWEYLMTQCGFEGIPSYLFYTKDGTLFKKYTAYQGNQEVLNTLNILLRQ